MAGVPTDPPQPVATAGGGSQEAGAAAAAAPAAPAKGVLVNQAEASLADLSRAEGQLVGLLNTAAAILQVQRCRVLKRGVEGCLRCGSVKLWCSELFPRSQGRGEQDEWCAGCSAKDWASGLCWTGALTIPARLPFFLNHRHVSLPSITETLVGLQMSSFPSLDSSQVDKLGLRFKSVNVGMETSPNLVNPNIFTEREDVSPDTPLASSFSRR